ncbi:hypothetical protein GCM10007362_11550 [Saccharibacillus endophyticus]|uniref:Uncharacterized protein n=1 Tax=Saccharibacillus endophyticus TaxID=2060666 RepID=A0ABQ1ZPJ6_9BACL|nr:hypothetical protein GCM10007362_11550 [Saccharibacillus endophyticus]
MQSFNPRTRTECDCTHSNPKPGKASRVKKCEPPGDLLGASGSHFFPGLAQLNLPEKG